MKVFQLLPLCLLWVSCSKEQESVESVPPPRAKQFSERSAVPEVDEAGVSLHSIPRVAAADRGEAFEEVLLELDDADFDLALETIDRLEDPSEQLELLYVLSDDLAGRGEMVRLPSLFWVAAHPSVDDGLKTTVLADLRRELDLSHQPDLGALALELEQYLIDNGAVQ